MSEVVVQGCYALTVGVFHPKGGSLGNFEALKIEDIIYYYCEGTGMHQFTFRGQRHLRTFVSVLDAEIVHNVRQRTALVPNILYEQEGEISGQIPSHPLLTLYKSKLSLATFLMPGGQQTPLGYLTCSSSCKEESQAQDTWQTREEAFLSGLAQAPSAETAEERWQDFGPRKGTATQQ